MWEGTSKSGMCNVRIDLMTTLKLKQSVVKHNEEEKDSFITVSNGRGNVMVRGKKRPSFHLSSPAVHHKGWRFQLAWMACSQEKCSANVWGQQTCISRVAYHGDMPHTTSTHLHGQNGDSTHLGTWFFFLSIILAEKGKGMLTGVSSDCVMIVCRKKQTGTWWEVEGICHVRH